MSGCMYKCDVPKLSECIGSIENVSYDYGIPILYGHAHYYRVRSTDFITEYGHF